MYFFYSVSENFVFSHSLSLLRASVHMYMTDTHCQISLQQTIMLIKDND